jgi:hypothetical protein
MSLAGLAMSGRVELQNVLSAIQLLPTLLLGLWVSRWVARLLDGRLQQPALSLSAAATGVLVVLTSL